MGAKVRPVVIISRDDQDSPRALTTYVPVTGQNHGSKYEIELPHVSFLTPGSAANVQGIASGRTGNKALFLTKLGDLPSTAMAEIEQALLYGLGMQD